jgi:hypothetical protein
MRFELCCIKTVIMLLFKNKFNIMKYCDNYIILQTACSFFFLFDKDFTGFQSQADKIEGLFIFNKIK